MTNDDMELVRQYARHQSEAAFATLVARHTDMVYSTALRQVRHPQLAEEITQVVFVILARKAGSLDAKTLLSGWLYRTACFAAGSALKQELRRQAREQEAYMESTLHETGSAWEQMAPLLDEALLRLGQTDRDALVLRFFEGHSLQEVGAAMGASEDAAKKRVTRAVEKLRQFFGKRRVVISAAALTVALSTHSVQAAPATLAGSVTILAFSKGAVAGAPTMTLIQGALKAMAWAKVKLACGVGLSLLLAGSAVTLAVAGRTSSAGRYQVEGSVVYHVPSRNLGTSNSAPYEITDDFTLTVNGSNWAVHISSPKLKANGIQFMEEVGLNGSSYRYDFYGKPAPGKAANWGGATMSLRDFPEEDGSFANCVWLGLASGHYFAGVTDGMAPSLYNRPRNDRVKSDWQLNDNPPYLPRTIDFFADPRGRPAPFDNGWVEARFRSVEETNVGGQTFPLVFTCEHLRPKQNGAVASNDLEQITIVTVNVINIHLDSVPDVRPPKLQGVTYVNDSRFPGNPKNNTVGYFTTASRLSEKPDAEAIKALKEQTQPRPSAAAQRRLKLAQSQHRKWLWISAGAILALVALIAGVKKMRHD